MSKKSKYDYDGKDSELGEATEKEFDLAVAVKGVISRMPTKEQDRINCIDRILEYPWAPGKYDYVQIKSQGSCDHVYYCVPIGLKMFGKKINEGIFDKRWLATVFAFERWLYNEFILVDVHKIRDYILKYFNLEETTTYDSVAQKKKKVYLREYKGKKDYLIYLSRSDLDIIGIEGVYHKANGRPSGEKNVQSIEDWLNSDD